RGGAAASVALFDAHRCVSLAALSGSERGQECRAEIALEMTAREIAEAQRQARSWLSATGFHRRAAHRPRTTWTRRLAASAGSLRPCAGARSFPQLVAVTWLGN